MKIMNIENNNYIGAAETAQLTGIPHRTIQWMCKHNRIPGAFQIGRTWAIPNEWVEVNKMKPKGDDHDNQ